MIISKTPVRISIGGGGTDLPSFYSKFGSSFISAAIDKYIYIIVQEHKWKKEYILKYSKTEKVTSIKDVKNEIMRECLKLLNVYKPLEIVSISDVGGQTGLGSSGAFTVGLLNALHVFQKNFVGQEQLAEEATKIAIEKLKLPSGKQDEYIAAVGGVTGFNITKGGKVKYDKNLFDAHFIEELNRYLFMFHTGINRNSKDILVHQDKATKKNKEDIVNNLKSVQSLGNKIKKALINKDAKKFGELMHEHWLLKTKRKGTTNEQINKWYEIAMKNGATGGKIMGAGGGGFFLFYCEKNAPLLIDTLSKNDLRHIPFNFDYQGTKVIADL